MLGGVGRATVEDPLRVLGFCPHFRGPVVVPSQLKYLTCRRTHCYCLLLLPLLIAIVLAFATAHCYCLLLWPLLIAIAYCYRHWPLLLPVAIASAHCHCLRLANLLKLEYDRAPRLSVQPQAVVIARPPP